MDQQTDTQTTPAVPEAGAPVEKTASQPRDQRPERGGRGTHGGQRDGRGRGGNNRGGGRGGRQDRGGNRGEVPQESDYEEKNLEVSRVTRVTAGGKRMRFRTLTVIGNRKGRVGYGVAKGVDVAASSSKAVTQARKALITVPLINETIPHAVKAKFGASVVLIKPAPKGTGIKAGGAVRPVLELAGIPNIVSKILGGSNKINNVKATFKALKQLRAPLKKGESEVKPTV